MRPDTIVFNGTDLGEAYGVRIVRRPWPYMPKPRVFVQPFGDANGCATAGRSFEHRLFKLTCMVEGTGQELEARLENVAYLFTMAHARGDLSSVVFGHRPSVQYMVRQMEDITFESQLGGAEFSLSLLAPDPVGVPYSGES